MRPILRIKPLIGSRRPPLQTGSLNDHQRHVILTMLTGAEMDEVIQASTNEFLW
jgi:hypothetical protein